MPSANFSMKATFAEVLLPDLLVHAVNSRFTGMFRAERESIIKVIYFKEGEIAFASSNQPSDRLGEVLIKRGQLTREQLDMAMSKLEANKSLGRKLVELGYLSPKELLDGAKTQVEEILFSLNGWREGNYEFVEGPLPPRIVDLKLNTKQVIFQCILQVEDRSWALGQIESLESVFAPEPELGDAMQSMRLDPEVREVLANLDDRNTVRDLAARSSLDEFTVSKIVAAAYLLNLTRMSAHEAADHGGEYLTAAGREEADTVRLNTAAEGSDTVPGFAPPLRLEADEERAFQFPRSASDTVPGMPQAAGFGAEPAEEEEEELALPPPAEAEEGEEEEIAYEEEPLEEEEEGAPGRPRWLVPALGALLLALLGGAAYWFFLRGGPGPAVIATPTPAATRVAAASPSPPATPVAAATEAVVGSPSPAGSPGASPAATPVAVAATPDQAATAAASPRATTPPAGATVAAASPTPAASPAATPTQVAAVASPARTPVAATPRAVESPPVGKPPLQVTPPPPTPAAVTLAGTPPVRPSASPTPKPTPVVAQTPKPTPVRVARASPPSRPPRPPTRPPTPPRAVPVAPAADAAAAEAARRGLGAGQHAAAAQEFSKALGARGGYALQLEIVCQDTSVQEGWRQAGGSTSYMVLPYSLRGRPCYRVVWGVFASPSAARAASPSVPEFFKNQLRGRPFPVVRVRGGR